MVITRVLLLQQFQHESRLDTHERYIVAHLSYQRFPVLAGATQQVSWGGWKLAQSITQGMATCNRIEKAFTHG
ncbi:hypothetical protein ATE80_30835 [Streptomyces kanasensis]|uniref:Uncharacterized protein n=1 Tax=Streptomyces kanasensis TaxID=936756 RepID=A0A100Y043_9ACTN|nr:hypothetical protein ATE80_30835 [Streptomyces kanasensis]